MEVEGERAQGALERSPVEGKTLEGSPKAKGGGPARQDLRSLEVVEL